MMAPIIPAINNHEIFEMVKIVSELGAVSMGYTIVRLNGENWRNFHRLGSQSITR